METLFHILMGNLVVVVFASGRCYCDVCYRSWCMMASDTDSDHRYVTSGQDKAKGEAQESCIHGAVLRSPEVIGWEVTF